MTIALPEKNIRRVVYNLQSELIFNLMKLSEKNPENNSSEFYLFCDKKTNSRNLKLFLWRLKYLKSKTPKDFFIIITHP